MNRLEEISSAVFASLSDVEWCMPYLEESDTIEDYVDELTEFICAGTDEEYDISFKLSPYMWNIVDDITMEEVHKVVEAAVMANPQAFTNEEE